MVSWNRVFYIDGAYMLACMAISLALALYVITSWCSCLGSYGAFYALIFFSEAEKENFLSWFQLWQWSCIVVFLLVHSQLDVRVVLDILLFDCGVFLWEMGKFGPIGLDLRLSKTSYKVLPDVVPVASAVFMVLTCLYMNPLDFR